MKINEVTHYEFKIDTPNYTGADPRTNKVFTHNIDKREDLEPVIHRIFSDCGDAISAYKEGHAMYKGMKTVIGSSEDIFLVDPKTSARKSANTYNYYTFLFDNLPSWKGFPKRSYSFIEKDSVAFNTLRAMIK